MKTLRLILPLVAFLAAAPVALAAGPNDESDNTCEEHGRDFARAASMLKTPTTIGEFRRAIEHEAVCIRHGYLSLVDSRHICAVLVYVNEDDPNCTRTLAAPIVGLEPKRVGAMLNKPLDCVFVLDTSGRSQCMKIQYVVRNKTSTSRNTGVVRSYRFKGILGHGEELAKLVNQDLWNAESWAKQTIEAKLKNIPATPDELTNNE